MTQTAVGAAEPDKESFEKFKKIVIEVLAVDPDKVTFDARFNEDLGADSLDLVELVMALEEAFTVSIDESELEEVTTIRDAYELVLSKMDKAA